MSGGSHSAFIGGGERYVDMFSQTSHVETVVLLPQQKPDDHIEIEINLDDIDATSTETKATYKEI